MPIYEFSCQSCGAEFEMMRSFSDSTMPACPKCAGTNVQRLLSRPAIHFKGSGWYINDSKNTNKAASTGTNGSSESETPKTTDAKPDSAKPDSAKSTESSEKSTKSSESSSVSKSESASA